MRSYVYLIAVSLLAPQLAMAQEKKQYITCGDALQINVNTCLLNSNIDAGSWQDCIQYGMYEYSFAFNDHYFLVGDKNFQCVDNNALAGSSEETELPD